MGRVKLLVKRFFFFKWVWESGVLSKKKKGYEKVTISMV